MTTARLWKQDIFGCCDNIDVCVLSFLCWPFYNGCVYCRIRSNYSKNGKCGSCFRSICCLCFGDAYNRKLFRDYYHISGNYCNDCLTSCLCPCCAIAQVDMENIKIKEEKGQNMQANVPKQEMAPKKQEMASRNSVQIEIHLGQNSQNANQLQNQATVKPPQEETKEFKETKEKVQENDQPGLSNKV